MKNVFYRIIAFALVILLGLTSIPVVRVYATDVTNTDIENVISESPIQEELADSFTSVSQKSGNWARARQDGYNWGDFRDYEEKSVNNNLL